MNLDTSAYFDKASGHTKPPLHIQAASSRSRWAERVAGPQMPVTPGMRGVRKSNMIHYIFGAWRNTELLAASQTAAKQIKQEFWNFR